MTFLKRILAPRSGPAVLAPLYGAIVAEARRPHWYAQGAVPDTLDGRFEMVAGVLALTLLRLETLGDTGRETAARLTELFVADMDGQLRQSGIGDLVVGKHIGRMMGQLGGRIAAYRAGLAGDDLADALRRNLYRGAEVSLPALAHAEGGIRLLAGRLATRDHAMLLAGDLG